MDFLKWNQNMGLSLCPQCVSFCNVCTAYVFMSVCVSTLFVCLWFLCFVSVRKPQKVKTSVVETPPLMRAVISQTSQNSNQPSKKHVSQQPREDHHAKNEDQNFSNLQEPNIKHFGNDPFVWSCNQPSSPGRNQDLLSLKDHLSINTHLFPERHSATLSENAIQERFSMSVDSQGDPDQPEPCQPHGSLNLPDCRQKEISTLHHEHSDVRNGYIKVR